MKTITLIKLIKTFSLKRIMSFYIFFFGLITFISAQSFNYFQQAANDTSDYFITIEWSIQNNATSCTCVPAANTTHEIHYIDPNFSNDVLFTTLSNPQTTPWVGVTVANSKFPGYSIQYYGKVQSSNTWVDFFTPGDCFAPCGYGVTNPNVWMQSQPLKNVKNLKIFHEDNGSARFTWDVVTDIPYGYELRINKNGSLVQTIFNKNTEEWIDMCPSVGDVYTFTTYFFDGFNIANTQTSPLPITFTQEVYNLNLPVGSIAGKVKTISCNGEAGVTVKATLTNPGSISNGSCWPTEYTTTTLAGGTYNFQGLYWGIGGDIAIYEVEAMLTDHQFRNFTTEANNTCNFSIDSIRVINLAQNNQSESNQDFVDITSYVISGQVVSQGTSCGLEEVTIQEAPPGNAGIVPAQTDPDGTWSIVVPEGNRTYQIYAQYNFGSIADSVISVSVSDQNVSGITFIHTAKDTLRGFIGAGCEEYIGQASLEIRTPDSCVISTINPNLTGYYEALLPSRPMDVEVTGITLTPQSGLTDESAVVSGFGGAMSITLDSTTTQDFIYRRPVTMKVFGFPDPSCAAIENPLMEKGKKYAIAINVLEGTECPVDTGYLVITDNISGTLLEATVYDTIPVSQGWAFYILEPGDPNFLGDNTKNITFTAYVGEEVVPFSTSAIVIGARQRGANFITAAPTELPLLILRDPPGDLSYSQFEAMNTTTIGQSFSTLVGGGVKIWAKAKLGTSIFGLDIWGEIGASLTIDGSKSTTDELVFELSNTQVFTTSSDPNVIGTEGDLFMGASYNFVYSLADELKFDLNTCSVFNDTTLMMSPDSFETTFIYTESWIRNGVIPQLRLTGDNPSQPDSVRHRARNNIKLWEQVLQLNEDLKEEALMNASNYSFDGSLGEFGEDVVASNSTKRTIEFVTQIDIDIAAEVGLEFNNNGFSAGVDVNIRTEIGEVQSTEVTNTTTTRYRVDDDDVNDALTLDIGIDPVYATPVFKAVAGQTSCPYEPPTARRDLMNMIALNPIVEVPDPDGNAFFVLELQNNSETGETRDYKLGFNTLTGNGATVLLAGNPSNVDDEVTLAPGSTTYIVTVSRPAGLPQYDFEGLEFYLYPACFSSSSVADLVSTVFISAYFDSPCSNIDMSAPLDNWLVNESTGNQILVTMSGYDLDNDFDQVIMQYSKVGTTSWTTSNVVKIKAELLVGSTTVAWDVTNIEDGEYNIRFRLNCGITFSYSNRVRGRIDRSPPVIVGLEKPLDDLYTTGKEISVKFNEDVNSLGLSTSGYYLMSLPQGQMFPVSIIGNGNEIEFVPGSDITGLYNQGFEVGLVNLEDLYNNQRPDTVKWQFVISEPDSDLDGNPDTQDRCPGGNDFVDSDLDGLPDDCDCLPNASANGRQLTKASMDFDGVNDYIRIPNHPDLIPTATNAVTMETWIYPYESSNELGFISSSGTWPNRNHQIYFYNSTNKILVTGTDVSTLISTSNIPHNTWTHVAVVYNMTETRLYINGQLDATRSQTLTANNLGFDITIGNQDAGGPATWNFQGLMDEARYWDHARTQSDIASNMNVELTGAEPGLAAYYNFNEGTPFGDNTDLTMVVDQTGNNHHGNLSGFAKSGVSSNWVNNPLSIFNNPYELCFNCPDTLNAAMDFDGVDDVISIPNNPELIPTTTNEMTFEVWLSSVDTSSTYVDIIASSNGNLYFTRSHFGFQLLTSQYSAPPIFISPYEWSHIAVAFTTTGVKIYVNGQLEADYLLNHQTSNAGNPMNIGGSLTEPLYKMDGKMDDIRFWNDVRTQEEIQARMFTELNGDEEGLVAYYNFNQGLPGGDNSGLTFVEDVTSNTNDGNLVGFAKTGSTSNWVVSALNFPDNDGDGLPDPCDNCFALDQLSLQNEALNGVYRARETIILGTGISFPASANVTFEAPDVRVFDFIQPPSGVTITVKPEPCGIN